MNTKPLLIKSAIGLAGGGAAGGRQLRQEDPSTTKQKNWFNNK